MAKKFRYILSLAFFGDSGQFPHVKPVSIPCVLRSVSRCIRVHSWLGQSLSFPSVQFVLFHSYLRNPRNPWSKSPLFIVFSVSFRHEFPSFIRVHSCPFVVKPFFLRSLRFLSH